MFLYKKVNRIKANLILPLLLFSLLNSISQNKMFDSLWNVYQNKSLADTCRLKAINTMAWRYRHIKPDTAIILAQQELLFAQQCKQKKYEGQAHNTIGVGFMTKGVWDKALQFYSKALLIFEEINYLKGIGNCYNNIAFNYQNQRNYTKAQEYNLKALKIREQTKDKLDIATSYLNIGNTFHNQANYVKAKESKVKALRIFEEVGDMVNISACCTAIGDDCFNQAQYPKALEYYLRALKLNQVNEDKLRQAISNVDIGHVYQGLAHNTKALEHYLNALKIYGEINNKEGLGNCYADIGLNYSYQSNYPKALEYHNKALNIYEETKNRDGIAMSFNNLGLISWNQNNYSTALEYYLKAKKIYLTLGNKIGEGTIYVNLGELYNKIGNYKLAIQFSDTALKITREIGDKESELLAYKNIAIAASHTGKYKEAFNNYVTYKQIEDSIHNEYNSNLLGDIKTNSEIEKREVELHLKSEAQQAIALEEKKRHQFIIISVAAVLILVLVFVVFLFNRFKVTQRQKNIIQKQKVIVEQQKHIVEEKQREIVDSITYAKRLQQAILPSKEELNKHFSEMFLLYKPKDIVAGDFYWMEHLDHTTYIAAADSTGHGVPGAMVSVVCSNALNRAVKEFGLRETGKILDKTRELVLETFAKSGDEIKDGMDISILAINKESNQVSWSGANNPLWYISNDRLLEVKPDKQAIGKTDNPQPYRTHKIDLKKNDIYYLMTDGYPDQFGGPKGKKFKYKQLEEHLSANYHLPLANQKINLEHAFNDWIGGLEQVDDVTIIGIKI